MQTNFEPYEARGRIGRPLGELRPSRRCRRGSRHFGAQNAPDATRGESGDTRGGVLQRAPRLTLSDIVELIQTVTRKYFYKAMTSIPDTRIWQDVFHVPCGRIELYVMFTTDAEGYLVFSFKEK